MSVNTSSSVFTVRGCRARYPGKKLSCSCGTYYPFADFGAYATISDPGPSLQHSDLDLELDVHGPHGLGADAERVIDDEIDDDGEHESDEADPHARVSTAALVHLDARPKRRRRTSSS